MREKQMLGRKYYFKDLFNSFSFFLFEVNRCSVMRERERADTNKKTTHNGSSLKVNKN